MTTTMMGLDDDDSNDGISSYFLYSFAQFRLMTNFSFFASLCCINRSNLDRVDKTPLPIVVCFQLFALRIMVWFLSSRGLSCLCVCVLCAPVRAYRSHASSSYVVFFSPFRSLIVLLGEALLDRVCLCVRVCGKTGTGECADFEERSLPVHNTHTSTHTTTKEEQE